MAVGATLLVYGADWCSVTNGTRAHLEEIGVPYQYVNIEADPAAAAWVRDQNNGNEIKPTLRLDDLVMTAPSNDDLDQALRQHGLL